MHVDLVAINTIQEKPTLLIQIDQQQQLYKVFDIQQMANQGSIDVGTWGGDGGNPVDFAPGTNTSITEIQISHRDVVDSLYFQSIDHTTNTIIRSGKWGTGVANATINIPVPAKKLTSIRGTTKKLENGHVVVESLSFRIGSTWTRSYGQKTGTPFDALLENGKVVGFFGGAGDVINEIGIHVIPQAAP